MVQPVMTKVPGMAMDLGQPKGRCGGLSSPDKVGVQRTSSQGQEWEIQLGWNCREARPGVGTRLATSLWPKGVEQQNTYLGS